MLLRHQPGSLYPSSLRRFPKENRRPGRKVIPSFLLFQFFLHLPRKSSIFHFNDAISLSELMEDIDLDNFLKEDQATLTKRGRESMACVVGELQDYLQHESGEGEVLPNNVFCDIVLQVSTCIYIHLF